MMYFMITSLVEPCESEELSIMAKKHVASLLYIYGTEIKPEQR
jgi:hypothetical protein